MAEISVIVPVYNVEKYIYRCVDSILAQTYPNFELILVDDGSPDDCGRICDEYALKDSRIHVIHQENGGLSAARNAGIDWAFANSDSQWLTFIDSDDWIHVQYLDILLQTAQSANLSISVCGYIETSGDVPQISSDTVGQIWIPESFFTERNTNAVIACGKLYKKDLFQNIRYPVGKLHEDEFTTYRLLFAESRIAVTDMPLYFYFKNTEGITKSAWTPKRMDAMQALKQQTDFFKKNSHKNAYGMISREYANTIIRHRELVKHSNLPEEEKKTYIRELQKKLRKAVWDYRDIYVQQHEWGFYVEAVRDITSVCRRILGLSRKK